MEYIRLSENDAKELARCFLPKILEFYESDEGKKVHAELAAIDREIEEYDRKKESRADKK